MTEGNMRQYALSVYIFHASALILMLEEKKHAYTLGFPAFSCLY